MVTRVVNRSVAVATEVAEEHQDWADLSLGDPRFDLDDAPDDDDFPSLPLDDDDLGGDDGEPMWTSRRSATPILLLGVDSFGAAEVAVAGPDPARLDVDPEVRVRLVNRHRRLRLVGEALASELDGSALSAPDMTFLFCALPELTARDLAEKAGVGQPALSRDGALLVGVGPVVVPLEFFFWKSGTDDVVHRLSKWDLLQKDLGTKTVRSASEYLGGVTNDDTVRNLLTWLGPFAAEPWLAPSYHAAFRNSPYAADRLLGELAVAVTQVADRKRLPTPKANRGAAVLRRALVGGLPLWH